MSKLKLQTCYFLPIVNKHTLLKTKIIQGNNAYLSIKRLEKKFIQSTLKNNYLKHPTSSNWEVYRRQRNKYVKTRKKSMNEYITKNKSNGIMTNKSF